MRIHLADEAAFERVDLRTDRVGLNVLPGALPSAQFAPEALAPATAEPFDAPIAIAP